MMSLATALGIGKTARLAEVAPGDAPAAENGDFSAVLTAAAPDKSQGALATVLQMLGQGAAKDDQALEEQPQLEPGQPLPLFLPTTQSVLASVQEALAGGRSAAMEAEAEGGAEARARAGAGTVLAQAVAALATAATGRAPRTPSQPAAADAAVGADAQTDGFALGRGSDGVNDQELLRQLGNAAKMLLPQTLPETLPEMRPGAPAGQLLTELRAPTGSDPLAVVAGSGSVTQPGSASSPATGVMDAPLRSLIGSPRWADELGSRLVLMSARGQHEGALSLTPEHLGPVEVRISVNQNTAHVWFGAQHADTRAALMEAMPRLRELFAEAGLSLGQAGVSHEAPRGGGRESVAGENPVRVEEDGARSGRVPQSLRRIANALVDLYV